MPTAELGALIARVEAATEGSRELDAEIALAIGGPHAYFAEPTWSGGGREWVAPRYTGFLDSARILVREGNDSGVDPIKGSGPFTAYVMCGGTGNVVWERHKGGRFVEFIEGPDTKVSLYAHGKGTTPALALCAAALRAMAAERTG